MKKHEMNLAEALTEFLKFAGFDKKQKRSEIPNYLPEILGSTLAEAIHSVTLEEKKIILQVKNPIWKQELGFRKNELLLLFHEWLGFETFDSIEIK